MITAIQGLVGLGAGLFSKYLKGKEKEAEHKRSIELEKEITKRTELELKGQAEMKDKEILGKSLVARQYASADTIKSAHKHDTNIKIEHKSWDTFYQLWRGFIRPNLTYFYNIVWGVFVFFLTAKFFDVLKAMEGIAAIQRYELIKDFYNLIIDEHFKGLINMIIGFWFGKR